MFVEPIVNMECLYIDYAIANVTRHYKHQLNLMRKSCNETTAMTTTRMIPSFLSTRLPNNNNSTNMGRFKRGLRLLNRLGKLGKNLGKFAGWTGALSTAGVLGSTTAVWLDHQLAREDYEFIKKAENDCRSSFRFGCFNHICWQNCGPRRQSGDWCYGRGEDGESNLVTNTEFGRIEHARNCNDDSDCNPCAPCTSYMPLQASFLNKLLNLREFSCFCQ